MDDCKSEVFCFNVVFFRRLIEERERPAPAKAQPEFRFQLLRDHGDENGNNERVPFFDFRRYHSYEDVR